MALMKRYENVSRRLRASDGFEVGTPHAQRTAHSRAIDGQFGGVRANTENDFRVGSGPRATHDWSARAENLAGRQAVEPRLSGSEPLVLPLNDLPVLDRKSVV